VALDDRHQLFAIVPPSSEQPDTAPDSGVIPSWTLYHLPLAGKLTSAAGVLTLTYDPGPPAGGVSLGGPLYQITMTGSTASFNMDLPIIDPDQGDNAVGASSRTTDYLPLPSYGVHPPEAGTLK
jgi:hypothetical protein